MIKPVAVVTTAAVLLASLSAAVPSMVQALQRGRIVRVQVHCPNGNREAFVTPVTLRATLGDTVEWNMAGPTSADSIIITPKNPDQAWPFAGTPSRGGVRARANAARTRGTYSYNVSVLCRVRGGGVQRVVIDPDIIID